METFRATPGFSGCSVNKGNIWSQVGACDIKVASGKPYFLLIGGERNLKTCSFVKSSETCEVSEIHDIVFILTHVLPLGIVLGFLFAWFQFHILYVHSNIQFMTLVKKNSSSYIFQHCLAPEILRKLGSETVFPLANTFCFIPKILKL